MIHQLKTGLEKVAVVIALGVLFWVPSASLYRGEVRFGRRPYAVDLTPEADGIWFYLAVAVGFAMALLLLAGVIAGIWLKRQR